MSFLRTESALDRDPALGWAPLLGGTLLLALAWAAWLVLGRIALSESTEIARLETGPSVHSVDAPAAGRVATVHIALGDEVAAGAPLVALDDEQVAATLREAETRLRYQEERLASAEKELAAEQQLSSADQRSAENALAEGRARAQEAAAEARLAQSELDYANRLRGIGLVSELELVRRAAEADRKRAALEAATRAVARLEADQQGRHRRGSTRTEHLKEEVAAAAEELAALRTRIRSLRREREERVVRAPVSGRIGRLEPLRPGSVVAAGARVAEIVPPGDVRAVAHFPLASLGRLHPGQPARLRLAAFPWTQYGSLSASVTSVGTEAEDGRIRVELDVHEPLPPGVVAAHGLVGSLTVEVERVAPLVLAVRTAGGRAHHQ